MHVFHPHQPEQRNPLESLCSEHPHSIPSKKYLHFHPKHIHCDSPKGNTFKMTRWDIFKSCVSPAKQIAFIIQGTKLSSSRSNHSHRTFWKRRNHIIKILSPTMYFSSSTQSTGLSISCGYRNKFPSGMVPIAFSSPQQEISLATVIPHP